MRQICIYVWRVRRMNKGEERGPGTFLIQKLQSVELLRASFRESSSVHKVFSKLGKCIEKQSEISV